MRLVLATANRDKAREIAEILGPSVELVPRPASIGEVAETGQTLLDNARLKARAIAAAAGEPAVADDTGLEVVALEGRPGVHSARFAGDDAVPANNVAKLLRELSGVPASGREARFVTVAVVACPDGQEIVVEGAVDGRISEEPRGTDGFGYDPVFVPSEGDGRTFAEMTPDEKHALSHRGRAFRALAERLKF